jgi:hypothetical protein
MQNRNEPTIDTYLKNFGRVVTAGVWTKETSVTEVSHAMLHEKTDCFWDSLEVVASNGRYKPAIARFLFPRSAQSLDVKICDKLGNIVGDFKISSLRGGSNSLAWDGTDTGGKRVPAGNYVVKVLAHNFEQSIRITMEK